MTTTLRALGRRERLALAAGLGAVIAVSAPTIAAAAPHGSLGHRHILPSRSWHPAPIHWTSGGSYNHTGSPGSGTSIPPRAPWHHTPAQSSPALHGWWNVLQFLFRGWFGRF